MNISKSALLVFLMLFTALFVTGCNEDRLVSSAKKVVTWYCELHPGARTAIRSRVDSATAEQGHRIRIECAGE